MHFKSKNINAQSPNVDDSIKPDFKVFWRNKETKETGESTFFTYEYGVEIIGAIFNSMYPGREILRIRELAYQQVS